MEKAPDAFRTISEVADDLDIPQHVLRFWETRFSQIKPMKRSGGRRYYRPDDVDLLKGIRHLLYGEGYTIRGVQRILKEQGLRSVQALAAGGSVPEAARLRLAAHGNDEAPEEIVVDAGSDDGIVDEMPVVASPLPRAEPKLSPDLRAAPTAIVREPVFAVPIAAPVQSASLSDTARGQLQRVLQDLVGCRALLDAAAKRA